MPVRPEDLPRVRPKPKPSRVNRKAHIADPNMSGLTATDRRDMERILKRRQTAPLTDADSATTGQKLDAIANFILTGGGLAAPLGVGAGAGVVKGIVKNALGIHTKPMDMGIVGNLMAGPSFGERGVDYIAKPRDPHVSVIDLPYGNPMSPLPDLPRIAPKPKPPLPPIDPRLLEQLLGTGMYPEIQRQYLPQPKRKPVR